MRKKILGNQDIKSFSDKILSIDNKYIEKDMWTDEFINQFKILEIKYLEHFP